ncbi:phage portal protein [Nocardioides nanhaiensis]|uniref:Phage portal protein n=1 Tax=Nocardioides nanhaiensis TaxID=1476871 RepID=A0ABP8WZQ8_9ACTN
MGAFWDFVIGRPSPVVEAATNPTSVAFAVDATSIDPAVFGLTSYSDPIAPAPRISRREAIQVPAVKRTRDLIASTLGQLPLDVHDLYKTERTSDVLDQPERGRPRMVTMTRTVEDMLFEGVAWWRVVERAFDGFPKFVEHLAPNRVQYEPETGIYRVDGRQVNPADLIQFESPNDALLVAGARAIRTCLKLDAAAALYADEPMPTGYFAPNEGADPADDEDVIALLTAWRDARKTKSTAYVPASLKYQPVQFTPAEIQLADARQHAVLEIARVAGVDPEELGVSTTSRTYANQQDRRKAFLDFTLGPYMRAFEQRLSLNDVTRRGHEVRFNLSDFLRSDDKTRMETYRLGLDVGAYAPDEIRALENKPPLPAPATPRALPAAAPAQEATS